MRYFVAVLVVAVAALAWWVGRDRSPARAPPASPGTAEPETTSVDFQSPEQERLIFVGRVVGAAPGFRAEVTVDVLGQGHWETRPGEDGAYAVRAGRRPERGRVPVHVEATMGELGAAADVWLAPQSQDRIRVPTLVLCPLHPLRITVTAAGGPVSGARVVTGPPATPSGVASTDASGTLDLRLPAGEHEIRIACDGYGRAEANARVPDVAAVSVELPRERTVTVTVVDKATGAPVVGAVLDLHEQRPRDTLGLFSPPLDVAPTDARGVTVLRGLADETVVRVAVRAPGYPPPETKYGVGRVTIPAFEREFRIEIEPPRVVRWPVVAGELPVPPDGTRIALRPWSSSYLKEVPGEGVMEGTDLVVDGWGPGGVHGIAEEPGGGLALLQAGSGQEVGPEISFRRPRRVDVFAHEPSGAPIEGAAFELRTRGGSAMAPIGLTGGDGRLAFPGLIGGRTGVHYLPNPASAWGVTSAGYVDLEVGDGFVDVVLQPVVELVVRVRVEGEPGIPAGYELYADRAPVEADEDFERGILRANVRPSGDAIQVAFGAPGFAPVRTETRTGDVDIDLRSGTMLTLEVIGAPEGDTSVDLEVWREEFGGWTEVYVPMPVDWAYRKLAPGRYRAVDRRSGVVSDEVRLENGATARLVLDLSRTGLVRGRVEMPEGTDQAYVRVQVSGMEVHGVESNRVGLSADGTFRLSVPGDRTITLRASHPTLRAANEVAVTRPQDGIVLRIEPGPTAALELDRAPHDPVHWKPEVPVLLYRGQPEGEPVARLRGALQERAIAFGGFEPGTYDVWIDARPFAPITLRGVALADGANDLGRIEASLGSSVRVKIVVPKGQAAPRISVHAWRTTEPVYTRNLDSGGESEVTLPGLGPGTFHVSVGPRGGDKRLERELTLDGQETREIELDLR